MTRRRRHLLPLTFGLLVAAVGVTGGAPTSVSAGGPGAVIDEFTLDPPATLEATCPNAEPVADSYQDAAILGGELDLALICEPTTFGSMQVTVGPDGVVHDGALGDLGRASLVWDGPDNSPGLDAVGLGGIDLTIGGRTDSLTFAVTSGEVTPLGGSAIDIYVYSDAGRVSRRHIGLPEVAGEFTVPFASFGPHTGAGADFTDVGAIMLNLADGEGDGPLTIGPVLTTSIGYATMRDTLVVDADHDGHATPGDTIEYTTTLTNTTDLVATPAVAASLTLTPQGGSLVPGSVVASEGTVTTGNGPTDTSVAVALGDIADGASRTVTFRVIAGDGPTLANQGGFTYTITDQDRTTTTDTDTDDPDTPQLLDPTVTNLVPVVANDDTGTTAFGTPTTGNVLANDTGPGGGLVASLWVAPVHGTMVLDADGSFTYTPEAGFSGTDTFTYHATSVAFPADSDEAVATITVDPAPEPVVATDDSFDTSYESPVSGNVLTNDTGGDGTLAAELVDAPANGTLVLDPDGTFTYTPADGFQGTDAFTYRAVQAGAGVGGPTGPAGPLALTLPADIGTVTITVAAPPSTSVPDTTPPPTTGTLPPPPTTDPLAPPTIPATLPATGSDDSALATTAFLLLAFGAGLTIAVRRRRHA